MNLNGPPETVGRSLAPAQQIANLLMPGVELRSA
jgi:hypothetical protein